MLLNLQAIFTSSYSYFILFALCFLSSVVPVPEIELLVASFASFTNSIYGLIFLIFFVLIATVLGDLTAYFIARRFSDKIEKFILRFKWYRENHRQTKDLLFEHGFLYIFLSRFLLTGAGLAINYLTGFEKYNFKKFVMASITGQIVAALMYTLVGYIFKDTWTDLLNLIQYSLTTLILSVIAIYILYRIVRHYRLFGRLHRLMINKLKK